MSDEHSHWFAYADENLAVARLALAGGYYNACLQNVQQAVEKYLKTALLARNVAFHGRAGAQSHTTTSLTLAGPAQSGPVYRNAENNGSGLFVFLEFFRG